MQILNNINLLSRSIFHSSVNPCTIGSLSRRNSLSKLCDNNNIKLCTTFSSSSSVISGGCTVLCSAFQRLHSRALYSSDSMSSHKRVCIIGSGNWGSAIAKIVGGNVTKLDAFENEVRMYVYEEDIGGRKLTEIINTDHENVKYLPGHQLPENVVALPDVSQTALDADILLFVLPHQFIKPICRPLVGKLKSTAVGISLIKGFDIAEGGGIELISRSIGSLLSIPMSVLMGANLAKEVAEEKFCETTIGCRDRELGRDYRELFQTEYFRVVVVDDVEAVEVCGALKNIVATGAGFVDGLGYGDNTKAAIIRLGMMEIIKFCEVFYAGSQLGTFFESCGVADLITTCYGGRNRKVAEAFVTQGKTIEQLEKELLNGQKLQGPQTAAEVNFMLKARDMEDRFPLFTAIDRICKGDIGPDQMIECIRKHPEHMCNFDAKRITVGQ